MKTTVQKREELLQLAKQRKADRLPPHYCLADFHNGFYECDYVSPWTISACNVDADLMLIGQDWASSNLLEREPPVEEWKSIGQGRSGRTNTNLRKFLELMNLEFSDTYATNLFPFIKRGEMSESIPFQDLLRCARTYTLPQIAIVSPRMAFCLGRATFDAVREAAGFPKMDWGRARVPGPHTCISSVEIYGVPHPGILGTKNAGGKDAAGRIWKMLAEHLQSLRK